MKYIPVVELDASTVLAPANCGKPDGYYVISGIVYQVTNGCAICVVCPQLVDGIKETVEIQTSGVSESFVLKAMAMTRGDRLSDLGNLE